MNIECYKEIINNLSYGNIIGGSAEYSVEDVCEALDGVKSLLKGESFNKKNEISSNTPQKVMKLYSSNFTPEEIADMLNLSTNEVMLVITTSQNELTTTALRMKKLNIDFNTIADVLGVCVDAIEALFGELPDDSNSETLSKVIDKMFGETSDEVFPNGVDSGLSDSDDEANAFADAVFNEYIKTDDTEDLSIRERRALIDEENYANGYDHTGH